MITAQHDISAEASDVEVNQAMQRLYRARSAHYDEELAPFEPLREKAIERLALQPGDLVLDVGCGTGLSFRPVLDRIGKHGHVVGIEQCADMLGQARQRIGHDDRKHLTLVQATAEAARWSGLPLADAALFHFTHDILQRPAALDNIMAQLRPGARVVATGLQWAPPWMWPANFFVMGAALYSVSSLDGLDKPWQQLQSYLDDFTVTSEWMGSIYIASGIVRG